MAAAFWRAAIGGAWRLGADEDENYTYTITVQTDEPTRWQASHDSQTR